MNRLKISTLVLGLSATLLATAPVLQAVASEDEYRYGRELMSDEERMEHRHKMREMETEEEREAYRAEHHEEMRKRAQEAGVQIPDEPMPRGGGMGYGAGRGGN